MSRENEKAVLFIQLERARLKAEARDAFARGDVTAAAAACRIRDELGRHCMGLVDTTTTGAV